MSWGLPMRSNGIWIDVAAAFLAIIVILTAIELGKMTDALRDGDRSVFFSRI